MFRATALTWFKTFIIFLSFFFIRSDTSVSVCVCVSSVDEKHNSKWWRPQSFVDMKNEYSQTSARFKWKKIIFLFYCCCCWMCKWIIVVDTCDRIHQTEVEKVSTKFFDLWSAQCRRSLRFVGKVNWITHSSCCHFVSVAIRTFFMRLRAMIFHFSILISACSVCLDFLLFHPFLRQAVSTPKRIL